MIKLEKLEHYAKTKQSAKSLRRQISQGSELINAGRNVIFAKGNVKRTVKMKKSM